MEEDNIRTISPSNLYKGRMGLTPIIRLDIIEDNHILNTEICTGNPLRDGPFSGYREIHIIQRRASRDRTDDILIGYASPSSITNIMSGNCASLPREFRHTLDYSSDELILPDRFVPYGQLIGDYIVRVGESHYVVEVINSREKIYLTQYWRIDQPSAYEGYTNSVLLGSGARFVMDFTSRILSIINLIQTTQFDVSRTRDSPHSDTTESSSTHFSNAPIYIDTSSTSTSWRHEV